MKLKERKEQKKTRFVGIRLAPEIVSHLSAKAREQGRTFSGQVRWMLSQISTSK